MSFYTPPLSDETLELFEVSILQARYRFANRALLREALQSLNHFFEKNKIQKVLALAGDATLRQALVDQGHQRDKSPEEIENAVKQVACNENLRKKGNDAGIDPFIIKHPGQLGQPAGRVVMATTVEAIIGAVWYDSQKNINDCEIVMAALGLAWPE
ncbi:unnamed protein product [Penicillium bialowiezense]